MRRARKTIVAGVAVAFTVLSVLTGCSRSVAGSPVKAGAGDVPPNSNSQQQYPNLLKECEVLTTDILAKTVGIPRPRQRVRRWCV